MLHEHTDKLGVIQYLNELMIIIATLLLQDKILWILCKLQKKKVFR